MIICNKELFFSLEATITFVLGVLFGIGIVYWINKLKSQKRGKTNK